MTGSPVFDSTQNQEQSHPSAAAISVFVPYVHMKNIHGNPSGSIAVHLIMS